MSEELLRRVAKLEAIEAIKRLKFQYCAYCDDQYDPDGIAGLFTEDGIWDGEIFGRHVGRAAIREHFKRDAADIIFAAHLAMNPLIEIDGPDKARGKWRLIMPATVVHDKQKEARWLLCAYDEEYRYVGGKWLFKYLKCHINFYSPHRTAWAEAAVP